MRTDALKDMEGIVRSYGGLMTRLLAARHVDAADACKDVIAAQEAQKAAEVEAREIRHELAMKTKQADALIAMLQVIDPTLAEAAKASQR